MRTPPKLRFSRKYEPIQMVREIETKLNPFLREIGAAIKLHDRGLQSNSAGEPVAGPFGDYFVLLGREGGQVAHGSKNASGFLKLRSTIHPVLGKIYLGTPDLCAFDDVQQRLGLGTTTPLARLHVVVPPEVTVKSKPDAYIANDPTKPWTNPFGGNAEDQINEDSWPGVGDTSWLQTNGGTMSPGTYYLEMSIADIADPGTDTGFVLAFGLRHVNPGAADFAVQLVLKQGSALNVCSTSVPKASLTTAFQQFTYNVLPAEAGSIVATGGVFLDLRIRIIIVVGSGTFNASGTEFVQWDWGQLQLPGGRGTDGQAITGLVIKNNASNGRTLLDLQNGAGQSIKISPPSSVTDYALLLPAAQGAALSVLQHTATPGTLQWTPPSGLPTRVLYTWNANGPYRASEVSVDGSFVAPTAFTITAVWLTRTTPGTGGSTVVDINKNGSTIYATTGKPSIAYTVTKQVQSLPDSDKRSVAAGDVLTIDVDSIETGTAPRDLMVVVEGA